MTRGAGSKPDFKSADVKLGMSVLYGGLEWSVWSRAVEPGKVWLCRWPVGEEAKYQLAKISELGRIRMTRSA